MEKIASMTALELALWLGAKRRPVPEVQRALETWSMTASANAVAYSRARRPETYSGSLTA